MKRGFILLLSLMFSLSGCSFNTSDKTTSISQDSSETTTSSDDFTTSVEDSTTGVIEPIFSSTRITFLNQTSSSLNVNDLSLSNNAFEILDLSSNSVVNNNGELFFDISSKSYLEFNLNQEVFLSSIYFNGITNEEDDVSSIKIYMDGREYSTSLDYNGNTAIINFDDPILTDNFRIAVSNSDLILNNLIFKYSSSQEVKATSFKLKNNVSLDLSRNIEYNLLDFVDILPKSTSSYKIEITGENDNFSFKNNFISFSQEEDYTIYLNLVNSNLEPIKMDISIIGNYYKLESTDIKFDTYDASAGYKSPTLQTTGNLDVLLVPVQFEKGNSRFDIRDFYQSELDNLETAFNGSAGSFGLWNSVSSYYNESSFQRLNLNFVMSDVFVPSITAYEFEHIEIGESACAILNDISQQGLTVNNVSVDFTDYDQNQDGWIDAVWLVYNNFTSVYDSSFSSSNYWAYVANTFLSPNNENPTFNKYANAGYSFQLENSYGTESHTYIHETGHLLGSADYYNNSNRGPLGHYDMMSYNLGDHNAYTKFLYNWVSPYVVLGDCQIEISPSYLNGDCIILPTSRGEFSNAPYDEYLMIEFYYPGGLEEHDATYGYSGYGVKFNNGSPNYGIRIYHVDARLVKAYIDPVENTALINYSFAQNGNESVYFDPSSNDSIETSIYIGSDNDIVYETYYLLNSNSRLYDNPKNYREIQALTTNYQSLEGTYFDENYALFQEGDVLDSSLCTAFFENNQFNDGSDLDFIISIESLNPDKAVINFQFQ